MSHLDRTEGCESGGARWPLAGHHKWHRVYANITLREAPGQRIDPRPYSPGDPQS
jgi:hypothetical protein